MKLLFDIVNTQFQYSGGAEYIRRVLYSCLEVSACRDDISICCAYDSSIGNFAYGDLTPEALSEKGIETVDLCNRSLADVVHELLIDRLFIGVAQIWGERYDLSQIDCEVICVIHDLCDQEFHMSRLNTYMDIENIKSMAKYVVKSYFHRDNCNHRMDNIIKLIENNDKVQIITVSDYSKTSIIYNYGLDSSRISVCYSPERIMVSNNIIENEMLRYLITHKKRYYLLTNAHRKAKNSKKMISAFLKYATYKKEDICVVTTGMKDSMGTNHIPLPFLSESDLANAYRYCYCFLYPSYFEGFGYPPVEAMKFGKPVLSSNTSSMPEILGDAPLYFSPLYETDMFRCLNMLNEEVYDEYAHRSQNRYFEISNRQQADLAKLTHIIVD